MKRDSMLLNYLVNIHDIKQTTWEENPRLKMYVLHYLYVVFMFAPMVVIGIVTDFFDFVEPFFWNTQDDYPEIKWHFGKVSAE